MTRSQREKKATAMVALGSVRRDRDRFVVSSANANSKGTEYVVKRNKDHEVVCECLPFTELKEDGEQCEHIMAVQEFIKQGEPMAKAVRERAPIRQQEEEYEDTYDSTAEEIETEAEETVEELNPEWHNVLQRPIPPALVKQREGWRDRNGNVTMVDYIEWHTAVRLLTMALGKNWSWQIVSMTVIGDLIMCHGRLVVIDGNEVYAQDGIGTGVAKSEMGIKGAESDALKRAATKFGLGLELYDKEEHAPTFVEPARSAPRQTAPNEGQTEPAGGGAGDSHMARSVADLVTAKQLGMIRAIARELGIDADEECKGVMWCNADELSKRGASDFIKHLQDKQRG